MARCAVDAHAQPVTYSNAITDRGKYATTDENPQGETQPRSITDSITTAVTAARHNPEVAGPTGAHQDDTTTWVEPAAIDGGR